MAQDIFILQEESSSNLNIIVNNVQVIEDIAFENIDNSCTYDNISDTAPVMTLVVPDATENSCELADSHNDLSNLQGGRTGERYHLNKQQSDAIEGANNPSATNKFLTENDVVDLGGSSNLYKINGGNAFGTNFHPSEKQ